MAKTTIKKRKAVKKAVAKKAPTPVKRSSTAKKSTAKSRLVANKSIKRSSTAKKSAAKRGPLSSSTKKGFVEMAIEGKLCKRRRTLNGGYIRLTGKKCEPVRVITRGDKVISYRDNIINSSRTKKITAPIKRPKALKKKKSTKVSYY